MMRVAVAVALHFAVAFAVPVLPDPSPPETVQRGDMPVERTSQQQTLNPDPRAIHLVHPALQHPQAETTSRLSADTQTQLSSQAQSWAPQFTQHLPVSAYQPNPNTGLPLFPAQTQYQPMYQMPQLVYFPMFGAQDRNPMLAYAMPAFYPTTSVHSPANSGLTVSVSRPSVPRRPAPKVQTQTPTLREHGQGPKQQLQQPYQQQTPQIVYVVQQPMTQPFGGISSEEIQAQGRLGRLGHLGHLGRPQFVPQLVPQLGNSISPGSAGPFVPLRQPPIQPLNPAFPAISSVSNPVLFPSLPKAMPNIPSIQLPNPAVPVEETLSSFGASPDVPEVAISAEQMRPSASSPSRSPDESEKTLPTNPNITAPTVMTDTAPEPTASITDVYS